MTALLVLSLSTGFINAMLIDSVSKCDANKPILPPGVYKKELSSTEIIFDCIQGYKRLKGSFEPVCDQNTNTYVNLLQCEKMS